MTHFIHYSLFIHEKENILFIKLKSYVHKRRLVTSTTLFFYLN